MSAFILVQPVLTQEAGDLQQPAKDAVNVFYREPEGLDEYALEKCRLDIHRPDDAANLPIVVWFHGGGLTKGKKSISKALRDQGVVVVAAGYRLSPQLKSPVFIKRLRPLLHRRSATFRSMAATQRKSL